MNLKKLVNEESKDINETTKCMQLSSIRCIRYLLAVQSKNFGQTIKVKKHENIHLKVEPFTAENVHFCKLRAKSSTKIASIESLVIGLDRSV